jgi:hypothetical protein
MDVVPLGATKKLRGADGAVQVAFAEALLHALPPSAFSARILYAHPCPVLLGAVHAACELPDGRLAAVPETNVLGADHVEEPSTLNSY